MKTLRFRCLWAVAVLFAMLVFTGCSGFSKTLTRERAAAMIEASEQFKQGISLIYLDQIEMENGEKAGYWGPTKYTLARIQPLFNGRYVDVTPAGTKYFKAFTGYDLTGKTGIQLIAPAHFQIKEVTGITNAPFSADGTVKIVDYLFSLKFDGPLLGLTNLFPAPPTQKAAASFKLYDDGWRLAQ